MISAFLSLIMATAFAAPTSVSYEGVLTDVLGNPVTVPVNITARIAGDAGGTCVINGAGYTTTVTPDASGFFAIQIPSLTSDMFLFPGACAGSTDRYLLLTVDGDVFPAIQMDSAPFAMSAAAAGKLVGSQGAVSTGDVLTWTGTSWVAQTPAAGAETDPTVPAWAKNTNLLATDVPALDASKITAGTFPVTRGGTGVSALPTCAAGEYLTFNGTWSCAPDLSGGVPTGSAGGALSGTYPSPTLSTGVVTLTNFSSMGLSAGDAGRIIQWNGSGWITTQPSTSPTGTAGGDLTGTYPNPTLVDGSVTATKILDGTITPADLSFSTVNNLGGTPSIQAGTLAARPTFGTLGRLYISTDTNQMFRDTGSSWATITIPGVKVSTAAPFLTVVGANAGSSVTGNYNSIFGYNAMQAMTTGNENTAIGAYALPNATTAYTNVSVGAHTLGNLSSGYANTAIGYRAGDNAMSVSSGNIFLGNFAGPASLLTVNDKLYIDTSADDTPLIGGDFAARYVTFDGPVKLGSSGTCSATLIGSLRWNAGSVEFCNGTSWSALGVAGAGVNSLDDLNDVTIGTSTSGFVLKYNGSQWAPAADQGITGTLSPNRVPAADGVGTSLVSSPIYVSGSNVGIDVPSASHKLDVGGALRANTVTIGTSPSAAVLNSTGGVTLNLPSAVPSSGSEGLMVMTGTGGAGQMSFRTCSSSEVLMYNGLTWNCTNPTLLPSDSTKSIEILEANCANTLTCVVSNGGTSVTANYFRMVRFMNPPASGGNFYLNIASNQFQLYSKPGTPVPAGSIQHRDMRMIVWKDQDNTTNPITNWGWYYDGGDAENNDGIYHQTFAGISLAKIFAGTVSVANGFNTVNGTGTNFTTDFKAGDHIVIKGQPRQIISITNGLTMQVSSNFSEDVSNAPYGKLTMEMNNFSSSDLTLRSPQQNSGSNIQLISQTNLMNTDFASISFKAVNDINVENEVAKISGSTGGSINSGNLSFFTAASGAQMERMRITETGKVGIGTSNPQATLDVNGPIKLLKHISQPASCIMAIDGTIALTSQYTTCVCKGTTASWVRTSDGTSACTW